MEVHEGDLVLSTQGRAFWILDDLSPLQQLPEDLSKVEKHLFKPRDAYRTDINGYNPRFHIFLAEAPEKDSTYSLEILDGDEKVIRSYQSDSKNRRNKISLKKGLNIFSWDLFHQGPELVDNLVTMVIPNPAPGPRAVPGSYQVKVSIGDWNKTQTFEVKPDPRWKDISQEDYQAQLDLGLEISAMIAEAHQRIKNLRSLREQINNTAKLAVESGHNKAIKELADEMDKQLTAVEDQLIQNKSEVSQDNINYPRVFSNHIGRVYTVLIYDQHRPTGGVLERYEDVKKEYAGIVADYEKVLKEEVPKFNALLEKEKVARLILPEE